MVNLVGYAIGDFLADPMGTIVAWVDFLSDGVSSFFASVGQWWQAESSDGNAEIEEDSRGVLFVPEALTRDGDELPQGQTVVIVVVQAEQPSAARVEEPELHSVTE